MIENYFKTNKEMQREFYDKVWEEMENNRMLLSDKNLPARDIIEIEKYGKFLDKLYSYNFGEE